MLSKFFLTLVLFIYGISADSTVPPNSRIDCDPSPGSDQNVCTQRGCIWDSNFDSVSILDLLDSGGKLNYDLIGFSAKSDTLEEKIFLLATVKMVVVPSRFVHFWLDQLFGVSF